MYINSFLFRKIKSDNLKKVCEVKSLCYGFEEVDLVLGSRDGECCSHDF